MVDEPADSEEKGAVKTSILPSWVVPGDLGTSQLTRRVPLGRPREFKNYPDDYEEKTAKNLDPTKVAGTRPAFVEASTRTHALRNSCASVARFHVTGPSVRPCLRSSHQNKPQGNPSIIDHGVETLTMVLS